MGKIKLVNGGETLVDDEDFERLNRYQWHRTTFGYAIVEMRLHRVVMDLKNNDPLIVDHINGNKLDNRRENLRICNKAQNAVNTKLLRSTNTSGFRGVRRHRNRWAASVTYNYRNIYLGLYKTKEEAAKAYNEAAKKYFGEFAVLNKL